MPLQKFNFLNGRTKSAELQATTNSATKPDIFTGLYGREYLRRRQQVAPAKPVQTSALLKKRT